MEIKSIADLAQYKVSLRELWDKEEFQPVKMYLKCLYDKAIADVRTLEIQESFSAAIKVASLKTQMNLTGMLFDLPNVIQQVEDQNDRISKKVTEMKAATEGGGI